jgi:2-hydroxy-3-oxopropionate reductase
MAKHILSKGYRSIVHSRTARSVDELVAAGAKSAASPADLARQCEVVITMLPDTADVELVVGGADGVVHGVRRDAVVVDMSSISPVAARRLAALIASKGAAMLDAPVSGGEIGAIDGTLTFMVGGDAGALAQVLPVLSAMGKPEKIVHVGESGAGQICKACNQIVLGGTMAVVAEAIALARKNGVDPMKVRAALMGGFAQSRVLEVHGERMIAANYKPGFKAKLFKKDLGIAMAALAEAGVPAPTSSVVSQLVLAQVAAGKGEDDYSAIGDVIFELAHVRRQEGR